MSGCLWVPVRLPGLNELLAGQASASRGWSAYNQKKQQLTAQIVLLARWRGIGLIDPSFFTYLFAEPNKRRDPSNLTAAGIKLLEDALCAGGHLANDGWEHVLGFCSYWVCSKDSPGVLVHWGDSLQTKEAMEALLEREAKCPGRCQERKNGNE